MFFDEVYGYAEYKIENKMGSQDNIVNEYSGHFKMVADELKSYAASEGKTFLVARNGGICEKSAQIYPQYPVTIQADDYTHCSLSKDDFKSPFKSTEDFVGIKANITKAKGKEIPVIVFMDWAGGIPTTQLSMFASLSQQDQITLLKNLDTKTKEAGVSFAYPVYGGGITKTAYPKGIYDSTYFGTYDTIVQLATSNAPCTTTTISPTTTTISTTSTTTPLTTSSTTTTPQTTSSTTTTTTIPVASTTTITSTTTTSTTLITTTTIPSSTTTTPQTTSSTTTKSTTTTTITPPVQPCRTYDIPCWIGYFFLRIFGLAK